MRFLLALAVMTGLAHADGEKAGVFDYYVLALSWSPNFCALEGRAKGNPQCDPGNEAGWVLHGLWPQFHQGWPSYCRTAERDPTRSMTADMVDIMGSSGSAWHQWKKHGRCSGLSASAFFALSRKAYGSVTRPAVFRKLDRDITLPAKLIESAWLKENPNLEPDMLTVTCKKNHIQEVRICLSKDLDPVPCGRDVARDCTLDSAVFEAM